MSTFAAPSRPTGIPGRVLARLLALTAGLGVAFVLAPPPLAAISADRGYPDERSLTDAFGTAFTAYWRAGDDGFAPDMERLVDYWIRFHVVKGAIAAVLLIVLATLTVRLGRAFLAAGDRSLARRAALAAGATLTAGASVFAVLVVMANIQGAIAPFASLTSLLAGPPPGGELGADLDQVRAQLHATVDTGAAASPALQRMIDEFGRYHAAMIVIAAVVAFASAVLSALQWRRFARVFRTDRRARRFYAAAAVLAALTGVFAGLVAFANAGVAADAAPALLGFFEGGF